MAYCTAAEVKEVGTQLSNFDNTVIDKIIERCSRYFDHLCGVDDEFFEPAGVSASNRTVYGDGTPYLKLAPYVSGSLNTTLTLPDGYTPPSFIERDGFLVLTGTNGLLQTRSALGYSHDSGWWTGIPIVVSARWGYEATPADVKMAVIEMVINVLRETDPAELNLLDLERQPLRERVPPRVMSICEIYRSSESGVLV